MNEPPHRPGDDHRTFLDRLSDLDRGLSIHDELEPSSPGQPWPHISPPSGGIPGRRPALIDLFPPSPPRAPTPVPAQQPDAAPPPPAGITAPDAALYDDSLLPAPIPVAVSPRSPLSEPTYLDFYGLDEAPFSLSSDPKFLYHSAAHDRAAQLMLHAIGRREGIVLLTGETGLGKTTLCRVVIEQLDRRTLSSFVDQPFVSAEELLRTVLVDFGVLSRAEAATARLANATRPDLSAALRDFLSSLAPLQAFAVVIIDEAQNLPVDVLDQIRVLAETEGDERLLQVILVGQPSLRALLARPELHKVASRVATRCAAGRLEPDEVGGYIAHRLATAGAASGVGFEEEAALRVHELSDGVPRVVNLICDRALVHGHLAASGTIGAAMVDQASRDLAVEPPREPISTSRAFGAALLLLVLVAIGAGVAAYVFRADLSLILNAP